MGDQYKSYMPAKNDLSMFVTPVSEPEMKVIMQLNDGAPGRDGVTAKSLKCITDHIAMPLSRLANLSFTQGIFPKDLKIAMVSPLYKAKNPIIFSNYRPISLLSSFLENWCLIDYWIFLFNIYGIGHSTWKLAQCPR